MFVISRCQTPLNPRLGWEGLTPVNKAQKRLPIPLEGHPGCGSSQLSEPCFVTLLLECLHTAKCATPGKVLESGILAAFSASSWVAMGKWIVFRQPDQAPGRTPCSFHSPPVLENVSSTAWLSRSLLSGHTLIFHLQMSYHSALPGPVVDTVLSCLGSTKQSRPMDARGLLERSLRAGGYPTDPSKFLLRSLLPLQSLSRCWHHTAGHVQIFIVNMPTTEG